MAVDATYYAGLAAKRSGAGVVFRDGAGRVLIVEPTYKDAWELPGGVVEADESPGAAAVREIGEELGIACPPLRLWCIDWRPADGPATEAFMFVFDGGVLGEDALASVVLPADELRRWELVEPERAAERVHPRLGRRLQACLAHPGQTLYLEDGRHVS